MKKKQVKKRSNRKIYFKNKDMDFYLMCILAAETHQGSSYGEAFLAASKIKENDPKSWSREWLNLGNKCESQANQSLSNNHIISARKSFLRAYTYYRWGGHGMSIYNPQRTENYQRFLGCFRKATELMEALIEPVKIPWKLRGADAYIPGYFMCPDNSGKKRPTIVIINGGEMYPEDQYFWGGAAALERGYNVASITYEGQPALPILYPEWEAISPDTVNDLPGGPYGFMLDYVISRTETDPERIAGLGYSGGGYHIMHQASLDKRIKALIIDPPIIDPLAMVEAEFPKSLQKVPSTILRALMSVGFAVNPFTKVAFEGLLGMARVKSLPEFLEMMQETRPVNPSLISCPVFSAIGEGDSEEEMKQFDRFYSEVNSDIKKRIVFNQGDGASAHCQVDNFPLFEQLAFDWLDELFNNSMTYNEKTVVEFP